MARYVITGGAGFIGCNAAERFLREGHELLLIDNLSRRGAEANLDWLRSRGAFEFLQADIRDAGAVAGAFRRFPCDGVLHLAGQVAVTRSVADPRADFEANALGTLNVLEAIRAADRKPLLIYASTNKVYGGMEGLVIQERPNCYAYRDYPQGIPESMGLDFHSPYGCSKGSADQYVRDYYRIYGLPTTVFRQSCIYGRRQFGVEDQGWVAWFVIAAALGRPITIYGDGKQVRDVLFVDDLVDAYVMAFSRPDDVAGEVFNVGGGPEFTMSVWRDFGPLLEEALGREIPVSYGPWRPGDQPVYVSDIAKIEKRLGWRPETGVREGVHELAAWVAGNRALIERLGL